MHIDVNLQKKGEKKEEGGGGSEGVREEGRAAYLCGPGKQICAC